MYLLSNVQIWSRSNLHGNKQKKQPANSNIIVWNRAKIFPRRILKNNTFILEFQLVIGPYLGLFNLNQLRNFFFQGYNYYLFQKLLGKSRHCEGGNLSFKIINLICKNKFHFYSRYQFPSRSILKQKKLAKQKRD